MENKTKLTHVTVSTSLLSRGDTHDTFLYVMWWNKTGKMIFSGSDFRAPKHMSNNVEDRNMNLMAFLTLRVGDVESDYFDDYTPEQLDWRDSDECEYTAIEVYDYEEALRE